MAKLWLGTDWISDDEPCLGLYEMHLQSPGNRGWHRYQIIMVIREDKPAECRIDMGEVKKFKGIAPLRIPGGFVEDGKIYIEETVGRLRLIADQERGSGFDKREIAQVNRIRE